MPGSSNIQQWNPNQTNQETDSQYTSDSLRANGAANPSIFPSATANKLFYQLSTFIAAFAQALSNKGYAISDASISTLASTLANVVTQADLVPYAPLAAPAFTGTPTAPTPAAGDGSTKLATTYFVGNAISSGSVYNALFNSLTLNGPMTVDGLSNLAGGAITLAPAATTDNSTKVPNTSWVQSLLTNAFAHTISAAGSQDLFGGLIFQWGTAVINATQPNTVPFTDPFPTGVLIMVGSDQGSITGGTSGCHAVTVQPISGNASQFKAYAIDYNGAPQATNISWFAIGY